MNASDVFPPQNPGSFRRPTRRSSQAGLRSQPPETIRVQGKVGGVGKQAIVVKTNPHRDSATRNALPAVWARAKISDLSDDALENVSGDRLFRVSCLRKIKNVARWNMD